VKLARWLAGWPRRRRVVADELAVLLEALMLLHWCEVCGERLVVKTEDELCQMCRAGCGAGK